MKLAVVIINWKTRDLLGKCLDSLIRTVKKHPYKIIVVDNNSLDGSVELVKEKYLQVELLPLTMNYRTAGAANFTIYSVDADYVLWINPDIFFEDDSVDKMLSYIDERPEIGILSFRLYLPDGTFQHEVRGGTPTVYSEIVKYMGLSRLFPKSRMFAPSRLGWISPDVTMEVGMCSGSAMLIRKRVIDEIGFFDRDMVIMAADWDFVYRARMAGWKVVYFADAKAVHYHMGSTRKSTEDIWACTCAEPYMFFKKHFGCIRASFYRLSMSVISMVLFTYFSARYLVEPQRYEWQKSRWGSVVRWAFFIRPYAPKKVV